MYITIMMIFLLESISAIYFATGCLNNSRLMIESAKKCKYMYIILSPLKVKK